jgi:ParB family transcriptional regulator, chromosome partitioning protein
MTVKPSFKDRFAAASQAASEASSGASAENKGTLRSGSTEARSAPERMIHKMTALESARSPAEEYIRKLGIDFIAVTASIDPKLIKPWLYHDRDLSLVDKGASWKEFIEQIRVSGGNVQPICVAKKQDGTYVLYFGLRRFLACLELGLMVKAMVYESELPPKVAMAMMALENQGGRAPSFLERGLSYRKQLDEGIFESQQELAEAIGLSKSVISRLINLAEIDPQIYRCVGDYRELTYKQCTALLSAWKEGSKGLIDRAHNQPENLKNQSVASRFSYLIHGPKLAETGKKLTGIKNSQGFSLAIDTKKMAWVLTPPPGFVARTDVDPEVLLQAFEKLFNASTQEKS